MLACGLAQKGCVCSTSALHKAPPAKMVMGESQERHSVPESCLWREDQQACCAWPWNVRRVHKSAGSKHYNRAISTSSNARLLKGTAFDTLQVADILRINVGRRLSPWIWCSIYYSIASELEKVCRALHGRHEGPPQFTAGRAYAQSCPSFGKQLPMHQSPLQVPYHACSSALSLQHP